MQKPPISLCIFDLDGVIVDTAKYHYIAWKRLAAEFGYDLTEAQNEKLKGVSRVQSLNHILDWAGVTKTEEEKAELATRKNNWYVDLIQNVTPDDALPGVVSFIHELKQAGIKVALGSASKNARAIIDKLQLTPLFEAIVDGTMTVKSKPDPEVFLKGTELTNTSPHSTLVFEDAAKGIDAALAGGMLAVGIGTEEQLGHADFVLPGFDNYTLSDFLKQLTRVKQV